MKFTEFEKIMHSKGISSLADIARALETTPQAVSNWKGRDQVPMHIAAKIYNEPKKSIIQQSPLIPDEQSIAISDILLTLAQQLKVIILVVFLFVFSSFTYVQFIKQPIYMSYAKIVLPDSQNQSLGRFAGLASQFGVDIPVGQSADLSSPTLLPELIKSRTFFENIMNVKFYTKKHQKELSLIEILIGNQLAKPYTNEDISKASNIFVNQLVNFDENPTSQVNIVTVKTFEPELAKNLADLILIQLESLNKFYKSQTVREKTKFIEERIASVKVELESSEKRLKDFNESNRQVSTPSLQLIFDRLEREVEVQKGIFLTLKQQLELAKIEGVQEASIVQILDNPQLPFSPVNKNLVSTIALSIVLGLFIGIIIAFMRSYINNNDVDERRKLRRVKSFIKKKGKDVIIDRRISGVISLALIIGLPFYLGYKSTNPIFFGRYSLKLLLVNIVYILTLFFSLYTFILLSLKKNQSEN